jgi:hypothetical protein
MWLRYIYKENLFDIYPLGKACQYHQVLFENQLSPGSLLGKVILQMLFVEDA